MNKNPILEELYEVREKLLAEAGGTLHGLVAMLHAEESKLPAIKRPPARTLPSTDEGISNHSPAITSHSR